MAIDNKLLGNFDLVGIPPSPRGVPQIEVTFDIDANGILNVSAIDKSTSKKQEITIQSSGGLSESEIDKMVKDAETYKEQDERKKDAISVKNEAETLIYSVEKQIEDLKDKITEVDKNELKDKIASVREVISGDDADEIRKRNKELQEVSWRVSQQSYNQSQSSTPSEGGN